MTRTRRTAPVRCTFGDCSRRASVRQIVDHSRAIMTATDPLNQATTSDERRMRTAGCHKRVGKTEYQ